MQRGGFSSPKSHGHGLVFFVPPCWDGCHAVERGPGGGARCSLFFVLLVEAVEVEIQRMMSIEG